MEEVGGHRLSAQLEEVVLGHLPPMCVLVGLRRSRSRSGGRDERQ